MNRARLKTYAPKARRDFLQAVTDRARKVGLTLTHAAPVEVRGDFAFINGQPFPKRVAEQRRKLDARIERQGLAAVLEEAAYTWFNRFMALRYMELHGYLEHGWRVLSHPYGTGRPQILEQAEHVTLPGVDKSLVIDLKLDGTRDEELYKLLLLGQCHALHLAMPFLFERIDDQTELLLPDSLLASDSVVRKMITEIEEADWNEVEIIGWLYQFYISEKKDALMAAKKAYASADIPAVTQLFTPNWIVKYMVQNSLGRQWLATYPQSPLATQMAYYIAPAEQTEAVAAQLAALTPRTLDPELLTLIDPACGSGHILVEAYDLFKAIYLERGYRLRDVPRLILEKNLFGLELDDRAAQMAGFALLMKARADDRTILERMPRLNVRSIQSSAGLNVALLADALLTSHTITLVPSQELFPETAAQPALSAEETPAVSPSALSALCALFAEAKTYGSLLTVPAEVAATLPALRRLVDTHRAGSDLLARQAAEELEPLVVQAELLARQYDVSVMNPPYLGGKGMNADLKAFAGKHYPDSKADLFAMFIERGLAFANPQGFNAMVTMQSWMFLSSYDELRKKLLDDTLFVTMAHLGPRAFAEISGEVVQATTFVVQAVKAFAYKPVFVRAVEGGEEAKAEVLRSGQNRFDMIAQAEFGKIPGRPIAYWVSNTIRNLFQSKKLYDVTVSEGQNKTSDNARFVRMHWEVSEEDIGVGKKWLLYAKGGDFRKWYGNLEYVVDWSDAARAHYRADHSCRIIAERLWYRAGVTWTLLTGAEQSFRLLPCDATFDMTGSSVFLENDEDLNYVIGFLNSCVAEYLLKILNPTVALQIKNVRDLPFILYREKEIRNLADCLLTAYQKDWDNSERSLYFQSLPLFLEKKSLTSSFNKWQEISQQELQTVKGWEEKNNALFIEAFGLQDELTPEVPDNQIARADRAQDMRRLISYALGCMMGRYSLDAPGLIYAHSGNEGFDPTRYATFPADSDGILPLTEADWFGAEDTANRIGEFLKAAWPAATYHENLAFVADSLSPKAGEPPMDTVRRYLATGFYKDHLQTYKKRPIYWLFSSGKERAFQALVYLHRYNEGTLARMRMEYVVPLQSRLAARLEQLNTDIAASVSTADRKKREAEKAKVSKQYLELLAFDETLRHYADQRIRLDLDDGVKANYAKFGDLLAEFESDHGRQRGITKEGATDADKIAPRKLHRVP